MSAASKNCIIFVNRFFFPDSSATAQILADLTFELKRIGLSVSVIASQQNYAESNGDLATEEDVNGVKVFRVKTSNFGKSNLFWRALDYLTFYVSSSAKIARIVRNGDVIVAMTDPPLISIPIMLLARVRGAKFINWLQDLYPEVAYQLGIPLLKGPMFRLLRSVRDISLKAAAVNVVLEKRMAERVRERGLREHKICVIQNWTDDNKIYSINHNANYVRVEWGLHDKFVIGYSGNLGLSHDYETIFNAATVMTEQEQIVFLVIGGGRGYEDLKEQVASSGIGHKFIFKPYQPRDRLNYTLSVPDVHWISLNPELEGFVVPSKFYGIIAAGRPLIAIAHQENDFARYIQEHSCGFVVSPGDVHALIAAVRQLQMNPKLVHEMGTRARTMLNEKFTQRQAYERWALLLKTIDRV